jgi:AraC-like DNA-binding protein
VDSRQFRFALHGILHDLIPVLDRLQDPGLHWEINRLLHYGNTEDFLKQLKVFCRDMAARMRESRTRKQNRLLGDILQYIDAHYQEREICLSAIAERFNLTNSTLSRLFSEGFDMRFIDTVRQADLKKQRSFCPGGSERQEIASRSSTSTFGFSRKYTHNTASAGPVQEQIARSGSQGRVRACGGCCAQFTHNRPPGAQPLTPAAGKTRKTGLFSGYLKGIVRNTALAFPFSAPRPATIGP